MIVLGVLIDRDCLNQFFGNIFSFINNVHGFHVLAFMSRFVFVKHPLGSEICYQLQVYL